MEEFLLTIDALEAEIKRGKSFVLQEPLRDAKLNILIGSEKILVERDIFKVREKFPEAIKKELRVRTAIPHYISEDKRQKWTSYIVSEFENEEIFKNLSQERKTFIVKYLKSVLSQNDYVIWKISQLKTYSKKVFNHTLNTSFIAMVVYFSYTIKKFSGMIDAKLLENIIISSMLHDIGLLKFDIFTLEKKRMDIGDSKTNPFYQHPYESYNIIVSEKDKHEINNEILMAIVEHEEYYDGSGLPKGIGGEDISFMGRMISLSNYFELLLSGEWAYKDRHYRDYLAKLRQESRKFDPELLEIIDSSFKYLFQS